jgi:hypothetical protein
MTSAISTSDVLPAYVEEEQLQYRPISRAAIVSVLLVVLSLGSLIFGILLVVPFIATVLGLWAWRSISRRPAEYAGKMWAILGTVLNGLILVGAGSMHWFALATEVPPGYEPINFDLLQPDPRNPHELVPPTALALNGRRVFIKGYIHPSVAGLGPVQQFVLVPDMGTCCFGGQPKLTDMIEVTMPPNHPVRYTRRRLQLAGTLKVDTQLKPVDGLTGVFYQMEADVVK